MSAKVSLFSTVVASTEQVSSEVGEETVILGLGNGVYYGLDFAGTQIWKLLHQRKKITEIRDALLSIYDVAEPELEADLLDFLGKLASEGLIAIADSIDS